MEPDTWSVATWSLATETWHLESDTWHLEPMHLLTPVAWYLTPGTSAPGTWNLEAVHLAPAFEPAGASRTNSQDDDISTMSWRRRQDVAKYCIKQVKGRCEDVPTIPIKFHEQKML